MRSSRSAAYLPPVWSSVIWSIGMPTWSGSDILPPAPFLGCPNLSSSGVVEGGLPNSSALSTIMVSSFGFEKSRNPSRDRTFKPGRRDSTTISCGLSSWLRVGVKPIQ
jgi:hypothetical protein